VQACDDRSVSDKIIAKDMLESESESEIGIGIGIGMSRQCRW